MTPLDAEFGVRRIMVAIDGSIHASAALEAAAALAAQLHAELEGVFVQDVDLARLAALPVGREIQFLSGRGRNFTADELDSQNREQEACARRAIVAAAERACVTHAFRVARGQVDAEVISAAGEADLLVVGIGSRLLGGRTRLGGTARAAATRAPRSVMISKPGKGAIGTPLVCYDGSDGARRALGAAARIFGGGAEGLVVLIDSQDIDRAAALRKDVDDRLSRLGIGRRFLHSANPAPDQLCRFATESGAGVLVIAADSRVVAGEHRLRVLESIACPVLLVRDARPHASAR